MSCNGCRALRKGCSESCILRPCLQWIETPESQGHATLFVAKFFGRADLMSFISAVPFPQRPALFQSLLFEACGRTINPVNGAVGLLAMGNWHVCQAAVQTVLSGGVPQPISPEMLATVLSPTRVESLSSMTTNPSDHYRYQQQPSAVYSKKKTLSFESVVSDTSFGNDVGHDRKLLNLFV